jgi:hypothetical protein
MVRPIKLALQKNINRRALVELDCPASLGSKFDRVAVLQCDLVDGTSPLQVPWHIDDFVPEQ